MVFLENGFETWAIEKCAWKTRNSGKTHRIDPGDAAGQGWARCRSPRIRAVRTGRAERRRCHARGLRRAADTYPEETGWQKRGPSADSSCRGCLSRADDRRGGSRRRTVSRGRHGPSPGDLGSRGERKHPGIGAEGMRREFRPRLHPATRPSTRPEKPRQGDLSGEPAGAVQLARHGLDSVDSCGTDLCRGARSGASWRSRS